MAYERYTNLRNLVDDVQTIKRMGTKNIDN
jgi:hypothetical protein